MKDLAVNQKVEICRDNEEEIYKSLIQEVGEGYFAIQIPSGPQGWLTLHVGERVNVNVFSPSAQYCFTTEVIGRKKEKNIPMYLLKIPEEFTRIQRRDYVRIKLTLEVFFEPVNTEELDNLDMKAELSRRGVTLDISGGGMQLVTDEPLEMDSLLLLKFIIPRREDEMTILCLGRVVRPSEKLDRNPGRYKTGIAFEVIRERDRDHLIGYIFRKMLERHRLDI